MTRFRSNTGLCVPRVSNDKTKLRNMRRLSQLVFFVLWTVLFFITRNQIQLSVPYDLFLITDPLVAILTMGAAQIFVPIMTYSFLLIVLSIILGRVFCGWICPMGTLIDFIAKLFRPPEFKFSKERHHSMQHWKYYILLIMIVGSIFSAQWVYLLDPLVVLFRGLNASIYPVIAFILQTNFDFIDFGVHHYTTVFLPAFLLVVILALTALTPRFFCRYLCPLGAFYGLFSKIPLLRRRVTGCDACNKIGADKQCVSGCRMRAVPNNPHKTKNHECIRCFSGRSFCHSKAIHFDWILSKPTKKDVALDLSRRSFVFSSAMGISLAPIVSFSAFDRKNVSKIVRPPRVLDEQTFVDQCVRCSLCVQACPTQTLQPLHLEAGIAGFWSPAITPLVGGCMADCNACSIVCPTNAIPEFSKHEADKWAVKMGTAVLEKNRCISYVDKLGCAKCIKICPTKAIASEKPSNGYPKRPKAINYVRCIGCGLCEHACSKIVFGQPALRTFSHGQGMPTVLRQQPTQK